MDPMTTRERFQAVMNFRSFDRLPVVEWAEWWDQTIDRWHAEKLPGDLSDRYEISCHFGLDLYLQHWFGACTDACPRPVRYGAGIVTSMDDYEKIRPHLYPWPIPNHEEVWSMWENWAGRQCRGEAVLWFTLEGYFWFPRVLLGIERHLYAFFDQPQLIHRMNSDLADWHAKVVEELVRIGLRSVGLELSDFERAKTREGTLRNCMNIRFKSIGGPDIDADIIHKLRSVPLTAPSGAPVNVALAGEFCTHIGICKSCYRKGTCWCNAQNEQTRPRLPKNTESIQRRLIDKQRKR